MKTKQTEQQAVKKADTALRQAYRNVADQMSGHKYVPRETMGDATAQDWPSIEEQQKHWSSDNKTPVDPNERTATGEGLLRTLKWIRKYPDVLEDKFYTRSIDEQIVNAEAGIKSDKANAQRLADALKPLIAVCDLAKLGLPGSVGFRQIKNAHEALKAFQEQQ